MTMRRTLLRAAVAAARPSANEVLLEDAIAALPALYSKLQTSGVPVSVALPALAFLVARYLQAEGYPLEEAVKFVEAITRHAYAMPVNPERAP